MRCSALSSNQIKSSNRNKSVFSYIDTLTTCLIYLDDIDIAVFVGTADSVKSAHARMLSAHLS